MAGRCQQTFCFQKFVDNAQQCFAFTPQAVYKHLAEKKKEITISLKQM